MVRHDRQVAMLLADDMRVIGRLGWSPGEDAGSSREERFVTGILIPCMITSMDGREVRSVALGHRLLDDYLAFVAARARPNTLLAVAYDLKVFFGVVAKEPAAVTTADVLEFIKAQRAPRRGATVVRLEDGEAGLAARTIKRRLASLSG
jgi:integrase/recombinase XerD